MKFIPLKELVTINQGLQIPIEQRLLVEIPDSYFYITNEFLKANGKKYFIKNPLKSVMCNKNDILMTRTGNTGKVVTNINGCFHNNFFKINYDERLNKEYLYQFLCSPFVQRKIEKLAGVSTIPDLNHNDFYCICIPYIDVETQGKFGLLLSSIDQLIEDKEALINEMKIEIKYNLNHIFTNIDGDLISLNKLSKNIKSGGTPKSTNTAFYNGDIKFLSISDLDGKYLYDTDKKVNVEAIKSSSSWVVPSGTLVYTMYASPAIPFIIQDNIAIPQSVIAIELEERLIEFIYYQLLFLKKEILKHTMTGTQANLSGEIIKNIIVTIPSNDIITKVVNLLSSMDNLIELYKQELEELKQMKKYYLNKIFG